MAGDNGTQPQSGRGFDDLPYFNDYLKAVLRPKIERAIETVDRSLTETAWRQVISLVAADQGSPEIAAALLRPLAEGKLGLKIEARLTVRFADGPAATAATSQAAPARPVDLESDGANRPDVIEVRRRPVVANPLVNAVIGTGARPAGNPPR